MLTTQGIILILTAITTAIMAGLFFSYSFSVNPGLGKLPDAEYLSAMQSINRAIQNPVFFFCFFGTLVLLPVSAYLHFTQPISKQFLFLLLAAVVYIIGVFGVTVFGNVPLNEALDKFNIHSATKEAMAAQRALFENRWNNLNAIRTVSSTLAILFVIIACMYYKLKN